MADCIRLWTLVSGKRFRHNSGSRPTLGPPLQPDFAQPDRSLLLPVVLSLLHSAFPKTKICGGFITTKRRSWIASTALTVLADILLRKPLSVLAVATFYTIRENIRMPETVFVGTGRSHKPIGQL